MFTFEDRQQKQGPIKEVTKKEIRQDGLKTQEKAQQYY